MSSSKTDHHQHSGSFSAGGLTIQFGDFIRVLNDERELLFWCTPEIAERYIEAKEARRQKTRAKHSVLIWQGKPMKPASEIVVEFGPSQSDGYEYYRLRIPIAYVQRVLNIDVKSRHFTPWELFERCRDLAAIAPLLEIGARLQIRKIRYGKPLSKGWPYAFDDIGRLIEN